MKMKWCVTVLSFLFFFSAFAAPHSIVNRYVDDFMTRLLKVAMLTDDQIRDLSNVLYDSINDREDVVESYNGETSMSSMLSMKKELTELNDVTNAEVKKLLDEKQYEAFQQVQKEHAEKLKMRLKKRKQIL